MMVARFAQTNLMNMSLQEMAPKKLLSKRARKDAAGEGSSAAPQVDMKFDGHRFQSEEHQHHFEAIKGLSFLKERRVQLREEEFVEFQEEIDKRQWTQLAVPMAKYDPEIFMEFYVNTWPMEEGVRDKCY